MEQIIITYLLIINLLSFYCMRSNKKHARFSRYKIGKRTLVIFSLIGGSIGVITGMFYYKYLIERALFRIGMMVILAIQVILFLIYLMG